MRQRFGRVDDQAVRDRTRATTISPSPSASIPTDSITVCSTPSTDRHTLAARTPYSNLQNLIFDNQEP
jgi:hypothetical protein